MVPFQEAPAAITVHFVRYMLYVQVCVNELVDPFSKLNASMAENTGSIGITVKAIDHVVLTVRSIDQSVKVYTEILGMKHEVFGSPKNPDDERYVFL